MVIDVHKVAFDLNGNIGGDQPDESWADDFLRALGYLLVQANMLEDALRDLYWVVTRKPWETVQEDLRGLTLGVLRDRTIKVFEARFSDGEHRERLDRFKPELMKAIEARNQFVHASWAFDNAQAQMERRRLPRKQGTVEELRQMKTADVEIAIQVIGDTAERVWTELYDPVAEAGSYPSPETGTVDRR